MKTVLALALLSANLGLRCEAGDLDTMGVTLVCSNDPTLTGAGILVAQGEAHSPNGDDWEAYPPYFGQPASLVTWINTNGISTNQPNSLGTVSSHANQVGGYFYGIPLGVAPGVLHVDNYEADYFVQYIVQSNQPMSNGVVNQSAIVNQSFTFGALPVTPSETNLTQQEVDSMFDDYTATYGTLFCSGVNNGGQVCAPATAYNSLGVGCYGTNSHSSFGPTVDNGRSKPDLVAPQSETSYSTPYVAGAAAVLLQSAARGDGGTNTSAAGDARAIRALLINGALKPGDWSHTPVAPLDIRYGAGVLNLYYSWLQLTGGQQPFSVSQAVPAGGAHPPGTPSALIPGLLGWDFQAVTNPSPDWDVVNHYYFDNSASPAAALALTATLAWNRGFGQANINNLALFLYDSAGGELVTNSVSTVDNVQHIYVPSLAPGQYDLQVVKYGSPSQSVTPSETYALAFQFYPISPPPLCLSLSGTNAVVSWPWSPAIFNLQQTASLTPPIAWAPVSAVGLIAGTTVSVTLNPAGGAAFYRLSR
jgi:hypothetical protein